MTARVAWRSASRCTSASNCVEVAEQPGGVLMRDSKDPDGPRLTFTPDSWTAFLAGVKAGELATHG